MKKTGILSLTLIASAVLAACSSMPVNNTLLDQARSDFNDAQASPQVSTLAAGELRQAGDTLDKANGAWRGGESTAQIDHLAYVAKQQVAIARETAAQKAAELMMAESGRKRDAIRLEARTREAEAAQRSAAYSQRQSEEAMRSAASSQRQSEAATRSAEASQRDALASQRDAQASQRSAEESLQRAAMERQAADAANLNAQASRQQALDAEGRSRQLEAQLRDMEAKKTERGLVITLGDVLFDTNEARLRAGGMRSVQKLADFFGQYPQRRVLIEGFTDSIGSDASNQDLSVRRADSVRTALVGMGVGAERITSRAYGESHPVADNGSAAGRQLNRRVEMVVSDEEGRAIAPR